jgi:hypothetical protein
VARRPFERFIRVHRADLIGIAWIFLVAILLLSPALKDGHNFGPADLGVANSTLTRGAVAMQPSCLVANGTKTSGCAHDDINGDIIQQAVPWNTTDWQLVHRGQFPLWDSQAATGLPQFLNFESSVLALPTLVGYLVPLSWSFLVTILVKLLIAGVGVFWCCRTLGSRASAAALGGSSFMLSGALAGWLGWSISGPLVWSGAILASAVLTYRTERRALPPFLLAVSIAFAVFGGFPEDYALLAITFGALLVGGGITAVLRGRGISAGGVVRLALGAGGGLALSAILWLPGISVLSKAVRGDQVAAVGRPLQGLALIFAPGYDGLPTAGSFFFGRANYFETAASVSLVTIALALFALFAGRRRIVVPALAAMALSALLLNFCLGPVSPVQRLVIDVGLRSLNTGRVLALFGFAVSVLGALGAEALLTGLGERAVRRTFDVAVGIVALVVIVLGVRSLGSGLPPAFAHLRRQSMLWPVGTTIFLVLVALALELAQRERWRSGRMIRRVLPIALVMMATSSALFAEVGINSYAHTAYPRTAATESLTAIVGSSLLGLDGGNATISPSSPTGLRSWEGIGFYPNVNAAYGVDELALHDPAAPGAYFSSWPVRRADPGGALNLFVPDVNSIALARRYGVEYVLTLPGLKAPSGMRPVATIAGGLLSQVPRSGKFTVGPDGSPVASTHPDDTTYVVDTAGRHGSLLARITNSPGWHASANGRPLAVRAVGGATPRTGVFLAVEIPPGATSVRFHYTPPHLALAVALELASLIGFALAGAWCHRRRRAGMSPHPRLENDAVGP